METKIESEVKEKRKNGKNRKRYLNTRVGHMRMAYAIIIYLLMHSVYTYIASKVM